MSGDAEDADELDVDVDNPQEDDSASLPPDEDDSVHEDEVDPYDAEDTGPHDADPGAGEL